MPNGLNNTHVNFTNPNVTSPTGPDSSDNIDYWPFLLGSWGLLIFLLILFCACIAGAGLSAGRRHEGDDDRQLTLRGPHTTFPAGGEGSAIPPQTDLTTETDTVVELPSGTDKGQDQGEADQGSCSY